SGIGSRVSRARQPDGNRGATAGGGTNGDLFMLRAQAYRTFPPGVTDGGSFWAPVPTFRSPSLSIGFGIATPRTHEVQLGPHPLWLGTHARKADSFMVPPAERPKPARGLIGSHGVAGTSFETGSLSRAPHRRLDLAAPRRAPRGRHRSRPPQGRS